MPSERPEYIEKLRAEIRGHTFRPAKRTKQAADIIDPHDECRYAFPHPAPDQPAAWC